MQTQCNTNRMEFHPHNKRHVLADFDGGKITSDAGAALLREAEMRLGAIDAFSGSFTDHRDQRYVEHSVKDLVAQRVMGLCLGYEDINDHEQLRRDPALALAVGKADIEGNDRARQRDRGGALAGKSTLNRQELAGDSASTDRYKRIELDMEKASDVFVELFLRMNKKAPKRITLDLDATDDILHGLQEGRFFHGYYRDYCYLPLYIFCGEHLLCAKIRPANIDAGDGAVEELDRIVSKIRQTWPKVRIKIRADSGFCREHIMSWCEDNGVGFVLGLAKNERLTELLSGKMAEAKALFEDSGQASRLYGEFGYRTRQSWSRSRRVIGKAEHLSKGANPRFIVTSIDAEEMGGKELYEDVYCARGDMENRIKEQQTYMFADRTSSATMRANQIRLWFSSVAYTLMQYIRSVALEGTELARAQCHTIRLKLLKIGARIRVTARRIWISMASGCPYAKIFERALIALGKSPPIYC